MFRHGVHLRARLLASKAAARVAAIRPNIAVLSVLLIGGAFYTAYRGQRLFETKSDLFLGGILFLVAALILIVVSFYPRQQAQVLEGPGPSEAARKSSPALSRRARFGAWLRRGLLNYWPFLLVLGLGISWRLYRLNGFPFGVWFDEAQNGIVAREILRDPLDYHPVFISGLTQLPAFFFYVYAIAMRVMGEGIMALRSTSAIAGILTVAALYLLARELFGHRVALLATFFLAIMRWHLNFSRVAFNGIFAPLFMVLALYFLVRGLRGKGWWNFALSGVMVGVGLQSYYAFAFVPLIILLYWAHHLVFERRRKVLPLMAGLVVVGLTSALVILPLGLYTLQNTDVALERPRTASITTGKSRGEVPDAVIRATKIHALMFNVEGDRNARHNIPGIPMLDTFTGMFFLLGLALSISRVHQSRYFLLLVWMALMMQSGIWSLDFEAPQGYRTLAVTPAVALLAALPLALLWDVAFGRKEQDEGVETARPWRVPGLALVRAQPLKYAGQAAVAGGLLFLLAQSAYENFDTFFDEQANHPVVWTYFNPVETIVAEGLEQFGDDVAVYVSPTIVNHPTIRFLAPDAPPQTVIDLPRDIPLEGEQDVAIFFDNRDTQAFSWVQDMYPEGTFSQYAPPQQIDPVLSEAIIPREIFRALNGVDAVYYAVGDAAPLRRQENGFSLDWNNATPSPPFRAQLSAALKVPAPANRGLRLAAPGSIRLYLDRELVAEGEGVAEVRGEIALGLHDLVAEIEAGSPGAVRLDWLTETGDWQPVPDSALFRDPVAAHGLTGSYYPLEALSAAGPDIELSGPPHVRRVDPYVAYIYHVNPVGLPGGFAAIWKGKLIVPEPGGHLLGIDAIDQAVLLVDGEERLRTASQYVQSDVPLAAGTHEIEYRYVARGGFPRVHLFWVPPDEPREVIPPEFLLPK